MTRLRRVVTGSVDGRSVIVRDEEMPPITLQGLPGSEFFRIWGADGLVSMPSAGTQPSAHNYFPPPGGFRFILFTLPPESNELPPGVDPVAAVTEIAEKLPGMLEVLDPSAPGMHTTSTIDYNYVVSGEVYMEVDDGAEVLLRAGDCVVQNGTRHAWHNRSDQPCVIAGAIVGAQSSG